MLVLGIETSCDETALALIESSSNSAWEIKADLIASQDHIHSSYGGVVPELAAREHLMRLPLLYEELKQQTGFQLAKEDRIAVTQGPGLKGCLLTGIHFATGLSAGTGARIVGSHHIEGHLLSVLLEAPNLKFPFLSLVVSGGHTELHVVKSLGEYRLLSRTTDDAAGETFDKAADLLGLDYPGGAKLASLADQVESSNFQLPKVMQESEQMSYSGLKTAISLQAQKMNKEKADQQTRCELAFAVQEAIIEQLLRKTKYFAKKLKIDQIAVCGGVSANKYLRRKFEETFSNVYFPSMRYSTDNAVMIAYAALRRYYEKAELDAPFHAHPRWPLEKLRESYAAQ